MYSRHRNSIDPSKHVCSLCKGRLTFLGKFNKDNKLVQVGKGGAWHVGWRRQDEAVFDLQCQADVLKHMGSGLAALVRLCMP